MNNQWIPDMDFYKIKVNKKSSHNNISRVKISLLNSYFDYLNASKISHLYPNTRQITKSAYSSKNKNIYLNKKVLKTGGNSNSEEKIKRNYLHIRCVEDNVLLNKEGNILDDLINNKYLKPILESKDIDEKLLNCNLKEPVKNNFNVSLNDFFNRRKKYYMNFKTPKSELNKMRNLSINTHNLNNLNNCYNKDSSCFLTHNKTMENSYINQNMNRRTNNNYYNDIQMTNNIYNNYNQNEINILNNQQFYHNNIRINNICASSVRKKLKKYFSNTNSNERNNFSNKINSPDLYLFKSQTYTQKGTNSSKNFYKYAKKNKEINIRNLPKNKINKEKTEDINDDDDINKKYNDIKNIIKHNNKYDYSKKLFDIYRGKLVKEFLKHIQKGINKYLLNVFKYFIKAIQNKNLKKIDEIFIPKIYLEKPNNNNITRESALISKGSFFQLINSDKKNYQRYTNNINRITELKRYKKNTNINNSAIITNQRLTENNNNILKANRNSMIIEENKNNIQTIKLNANITNNCGLIYKKKKLGKNNMHITKKNILNNSKGKIIDIDINLGKPIREINDINIMENRILMNDFNIIKKKKFKSSLSTNKREKRKIKSKSKKKKLSLPKKKYLEEISSSSSERDSYSLDKNINNNNDNYSDKNINNSFTIKTNNNIIQPLIYKTSSINNKNGNYTKNTLEKNIVTSDKRLFININYISSLSNENKLRPKIKFKNTSLTIKRNIYFPIFSQKTQKNKKAFNNYFFISNNSRNNNKELEIQNKKMNMTNYINADKNKYLNSCVKFIIKNINKVFLEKAFTLFSKRIKMLPKANTVNKIGQQKNKINTYKRKIGKNKN